MLDGHSLTHSLTRSLTRSLTHSLTHSLTLNRNFEEHSRDFVLERAYQIPPYLLGVVAVNDCRQWISRFIINLDVKTNQIAFPVANLLVLHRGVALGPAFHLIEEVRDYCQKGGFRFSFQFGLV